VSRARSLGLLACVSLASTAVQAQVVDSIPAHTRFIIPSRVLHEDREINVHTPVGYQDSRERYPVLYMPDGGMDEDFPHVVNTVDSLIALHRIPPTIVVGIPNTERRRDLTGPTTMVSDRTIAPRVGGSAAFRRFIRTELIPEIRHRYRTSRETAIIGESLAGLFIVETFLREPDLFQRYIALSPSLWWNADALVREAVTLAPQVSKYRFFFLAAANEPGIEQNSADLAAVFRTWLPAEVGFVYEARPELEHSTIFRREGPAAMAQALAQYPRGGGSNARQVGALEARCGTPELELRGVRARWGTPDSIVTGRADPIWAYEWGALRLFLTTRAGMVHDWHVAGVVTRKEAWTNWRRVGRHGAADRVENYLVGHPATSKTRAYALYRGCLQPGMTEEEVVAGWDRPTERRPATATGVTLVWGYGVEGQYDWARFEGDSLVDNGYNAGAYEPGAVDSPSGIPR
jgi:predicted alpha/beta superfamily hydrolase